ncbi:hypothetical protein [Mycoplasma phocoeninasale]|uniref:Asp23/Gls24 family envelope stress response protein n=1 Tax=Mycoplasma phocoeninasale TaxID=2726117 RepID=A0A858U4N9_9MOLU|nr:hypothetical protein [Mycoplasma phocoeninasale]MBN0970510.1 hypothetical protein [Mycoplasma phocoeninasale]QJG66367.1 hypothetical protein HGG64_01420 [Mycoplasma phocoeninasale]
MEKVENIHKIVSYAIRTIAGISKIEVLNDYESGSKENSGLIIDLLDDNQTVNIIVGLVLISNISAKNIVEEMYQNISHFFKKEKLNLGSLTIYIKGTK